jgi:hypothetical protein
VIESAIKKQPEEIYAIRGQKIINKLKSRRDGLLKNAMKYYSFLAKEVTVKSSAEAEFFRVDNYAHKTDITVYDYSKGDTSEIIYSRTFYTSETRRIYIEEDGADKIIQEGSPNKIKVIVKKAGQEMSTAFKKNK